MGCLNAKESKPKGASVPNPAFSDNEDNSSPNKSASKAKSAG